MTLSTLSVGGSQQQQNTKPQGYGSEKEFLPNSARMHVSAEVSDDCCCTLRIIAEDQIKILWASSKIYIHHNFIK